MSLPWHRNEKRNFICMRTIVSDIITDGLRTIFKQEWNNRYQATLGAWDNTAKIGIELHNIEQGRRRGKEHLPKLLNGNINEWDCTVLFDAILYSKSIGQAALNSAIGNEIDNLRKIRNKIAHTLTGELSEGEFENDSEAVRKSFLALGLPTKDIDEIKIKRKRVASFQVLPPQPAHEVIPRTTTVSTIINDLKKLYDSNNGDLTYFYISGNPGSGKSQLASQVGESHYNEEIKKPTRITFLMTLNGESLDALLASYEDFARYTNCSDDTVASILNSEQETEVKIIKLRTQIAKRIEIYKNWLVIVENVGNLKLVTPLLPEGKNVEWKGGHVLITTQEAAHIPPNNSFTGYVTVSPGLDENESCELLTKLSGKCKDDPDVLKKVAKELDHQPLALAAAAVYLQQIRESKVSPEFSWDDYLQKLKEGKREMTEEILRDANPAYSKTMTTAVRLAVEKAAKNDVILKHTFHFLSLASHESLPLEVVINYVVSIDRDQDKAQDKEQVGLKIRKCSLILQEENERDKVVSVRLHQVVQDGMKLYAKKREMEENINSIEVAAGSFYQFNNDRILVPHLKAFHDAIKNMFPNIETMYPGTPSSEIWKIFSHFGLILKKYGDFFRAKSFLAVAVLISLKLPAFNHVDVASLFYHLGTVHRHLGDLQQAKQYHEKALHIRTQQLGSNHVDVASSFYNLGNVNRDLGNLQRAKQHFEKAIDIYTEQFGPNHVKVNNCNLHLALIERSLEVQPPSSCSSFVCCVLF